MQRTIIFAMSFMLGSLFIGMDSANAQCIEGDCEDGHGIMRYINQRTNTFVGEYNGEFKNHTFHGKGRMEYRNGDVYDGQWENNRWNGEGTYITDNGKNPKKGIWKGKELLVASSGTVHGAAGCNGGDCANGYGEKEIKGKGLYKGHFKNHQPEGFGELSYTSGDRYKGYWKNGEKNGMGVMYYKNAHVDSGNWKNDKFQDKLKVWALVVGVADYPHFPKLTYTTQDAKKVYGFLRSPEGGAVPEDQIRLLVDEDATSLGIQNAMADLFEQADTSDLVIFYFAGHGKEGAFLPYDYVDKTNANRLDHTTVNMLLKDSDAKFKLCVADACHSGSYHTTYDEYKNNGHQMSLAMERETITARDKIKAYYKSFKNVKGGLAVIMSSSAEEISLEANKLKQGVFSYYFIKGLEGHADGYSYEMEEDGSYKLDDNGNKIIAIGETDAVVTVTELYTFIHAKVRKFTYKFQNPIINQRKVGKREAYDAKMPVGLLFNKK